jgi:hypothetical protein
MANGVNGRSTRSHDLSTDTPETDESSTQINSGPPPPIDAVDIGLVPDDLARVALEGGPPPRSPQDVNIPPVDKDEESIAMDIV